MVFEHGDTENHMTLCLCVSVFKTCVLLSYHSNIGLTQNKGGLSKRKPALLIINPEVIRT